MSRIAVLTSEFLPFHGGIGTYSRELSAAATALGHDVTLFAPNYGKADLPLTDKQQFPFAITRYRAGLHSPANYPEYAKTCHRVAGGRWGGFDRILAASLPLAEMMAATFHFHHRAYDVMLHGSDINKERHSLRGMLLRPARIFTRPARFFTNSHFTRSLLLEKYPKVALERVTVTHLGVDAYWFVNPMGDQNIASVLGIEPGRTVISTVARITPRKGQLVLMNAIGQLPTAVRQNICVVLAGSSSGLNDAYVRAVRNAAAAAAPAQVIVVDRLSDDEIKALYQISAIFCLPGAERGREVEGFGLVILEAAAQRLPSIAGAVGGVPEIIQDGKTGILVPPDDPQAFSSALTRVLKDSTLRDSLASRAQEAARHYTWQKCAYLTFGPK